MPNLHNWPATAPSGLQDLTRTVAQLLDLETSRSETLEALAAAAGPALVILTGADSAALPAIADAVTRRVDPTVLVIGDGWIGTDGPDLDGAIVGGGAVALARSVAVRRTPTGRVNVVCVPEQLLGAAGVQRGPLALDIGSVEVADVVAFCLAGESDYVDGQVLYANGGRQLFSSQTA